MIGDEDPHHWTYPEYGYAFGVSFWKNNTAAGSKDANRATLYIGPPGYAYPKVEYRWPDGKHDCEALIRGLQSVFERGNASARVELQNWLEKGKKRT